MNQREADLIEQMTQIGLRLAELTAENKILKSVNDRLLQALPIHGVVRGGDFESKSVSRDQVISKKETSELTPNTPTEPLGNEGLAKSVCGEKPAHHWITLKDGDICCSECGLIFRA